MAGSEDFQKAIELINGSQNILITTHTRPDGDGCGSAAAMAEGLAALGKEVKLMFLSQIPEWYEFLFAEKPGVFSKDDCVDSELIIIVDTNSNSQLADFAERLEQNRKKVLVIDHHVTGDGLGDVELIDTTSAAAGQIVFELFKFAGWEMTGTIARSLFVAIASDTGWFRFSNTDSRVYRDCGQLTEHGVNSAQLYRDLYLNFSSARFALRTAMLNTVELHLNGRFAAQHLLQTDFARTGASNEDTENLIDECQRINSVEACALFVEQPDGRIKCSLRSTGDVDVRKIAQKFGGGGHTMASGLHLPGSMENAKKIIYDEIEKQLS